MHGGSLEVEHPKGLVSSNSLKVRVAPLSCMYGRRAPARPSPVYGTYGLHFSPDLCRENTGDCSDSLPCYMGVAPGKKSKALRG